MTHPKNNSDRIFLLQKVNFSDSHSSFWWFIESQIKSGFPFFQKMYSKDFVTNRTKYWSLIGQIVSRQNWIWHSIIQNSDSSVSEKKKKRKNNCIFKQYTCICKKVWNITGLNYRSFYHSPGHLLQTDRPELVHNVLAMVRCRPILVRLCLKLTVTTSRQDKSDLWTINSRPLE